MPFVKSAESLRSRLGLTHFPLPVLVGAIVLAIVACLFTGVVKEPVIQEQDFPFSGTYRLDGETKTYEGVYNCRFFSTGEGISPRRDTIEAPTSPTPPTTIPPATPSQRRMVWNWSLLPFSTIIT